MKSLVSLVALVAVLALAATAPAQCPGGVCPPSPPAFVQPRPVVIYRTAAYHQQTVYSAPIIQLTSPVVRYVQPSAAPTATLSPTYAPRYQTTFYASPMPRSAPTVCTGPNCRR